MRRREPIASMVAAALVLASCATIGSTVHVEPPTGKSQAAFNEDRAACTTSTNAAVQPYANRLNLGVGRSADEIAADNGRIQQVYDQHYAECMTARGNRVAGIPPAVTPAPRPDDAVGRAQEALDMSPPMDAVSTSAARSVEAKVAEFRTACPDETIAVHVRPAPAPRTTAARLVALTEPHGGSCFGARGELDYLVVGRGDRWKTVLEGVLAISDTTHAGFGDVDLQGPGLCVKTYHWSGAAYRQVGQRDCG